MSSVAMVQALAARPGLPARRPAPASGARCPAYKIPSPPSRAAHVQALRVKYHEDEDEVMGSDWSASWSLKSYEDLSAQIIDTFELNSDLANDTLGNVMSSPPITCTADTPIAELKFDTVSGMPVVNADGKLIGVVSKKDLFKSESGTVKDIMSRPPIAVKPGYLVSDGASIMLKYAVHRLPVVDEEKRVIGMVTRNDISKALDSGKAPVHEEEPKP